MPLLEPGCFKQRTFIGFDIAERGSSRKTVDNQEISSGWKEGVSPSSPVMEINYNYLIFRDLPKCRLYSRVEGGNFTCNGDI